MDIKHYSGGLRITNIYYVLMDIPKLSHDGLISKTRNNRRFNQTKLPVSG